MPETREDMCICMYCALCWAALFFSLQTILPPPQGRHVPFLLHAGPTDEVALPNEPRRGHGGLGRSGPRRGAGMGGWEHAVQVEAARPGPGAGQGDFDEHPGLKLFFFFFLGWWFYSFNKDWGEIIFVARRQDEDGGVRWNMTYATCFEALLPLTPCCFRMYSIMSA